MPLSGSVSFVTTESNRLPFSDTVKWTVPLETLVAPVLSKKAPWQ